MVMRRQAEQVQLLAALVTIFSLSLFLTALRTTTTTGESEVQAGDRGPTSPGGGREQLKANRCAVESDTANKLQQTHHLAALEVAMANQECKKEMKAALNQFFWDSLVQTSGELLKIGRNSRSSEVTSRLKTVYRSLSHLLDFLGPESRAGQQLAAAVGAEHSERKNKTRGLEVCPEVFRGTTHGYPFFYKGFETESCKTAQPLSHYITILFNFVNYPKKYATSLLIRDTLEATRHFYPSLKIYAAFSEQQLEQEDTLKDLNGVTIFTFASKERVWSSLVKHVQTPYMFIAKDVTNFTWDVSLERLLREMIALRTSIVGTAIKEHTSGHWSMACHQALLRNYTLSSRAGYDRSKHDCVYCNYVGGPFLANTTYLKRNLDASINDLMVFQDLFIKQLVAKHENVVCPDVMFRVLDNSLQFKQVHSWIAIAKKFNIQRIHLSDGTALKMPCKVFADWCEKRKDLALSPCCLEALADLIKFTMGACQQAGIVCELQEGTALGAIKLSKVLPWERDADLTFLTANFSELIKLRPLFLAHKYSFAEEVKSMWCCVDNKTAGGKVSVSTKGWQIELYGQHDMDTRRAAEWGESPTRVYLDGMWVGVPLNPGLF